MPAQQKNPDVDKYISGFPKPAQKAMEQLRKIIRAAAPEAEEVISYQMPAYRYHGMLVYFAGYDAHVGFYPTPSAIAAFKKELSAYKSAKGSVQFPLDQPLPAALVKTMVEFRVQENEAKAGAKKQSKTCPRGHKYEKTTDCPTCPECEKERKPEAGLLAKLSAPARRALANIGVSNAKTLSKFSEKEILALHGMGKASLPVLNEALSAEGLQFEKEKKG